MWPFKRGPNQDQVALAEFRAQVDDVLGRALAPLGLRRYQQPDFLNDDTFEEVWYRVDERAVRLLVSIDGRDGPPSCYPIELMHASSRFDSALWLSVPIFDYIESVSRGTTKRTYGDYVRKNHASTTALLEFVRDDLLRHCEGFLRGDFGEFKRLYTVRHSGWTWRTE